MRQTSTRSRLLDAVEAVSGAVTVAAMIATPLLPRGGQGRRMLSSVVVTGLFTNTTANAIRRWGSGRAIVAAAATAVKTASVERFGTETGWPFGDYRYTGVLQPEVGGVPAIVPMAWFAMALPAREAAHAALGEASRPLTRVGLGAAALTAWDLFLDPQMVGEGYWTWARRGWYRGIPVSNYVGWFLTSLGVMVILELLVPPRPGSGDGDESGADGHLVATYGYMSVMETIGFARYFRDPLVAAVGGSAMLPIAAAGVARKVTR